jgi:hypothetical protein
MRLANMELFTEGYWVDELIHLRWQVLPFEANALLMQATSTASFQ